MGRRDDDDDDDDGDVDVVVRTAPVRRKTDGGLERSLTQAEINEIIAAQRKSDASAEREKLLHKMEMRFVEMIGADGEGGDFAVMQEKISSINVRLDKSDAHMAIAIEKIDTRLERVELFSAKAKWTIMLVSPIAGSLAALAFALVEHWLAK